MKPSTYLAVMTFATTLAPPVAWTQVFPVAHCLEIQPGPPIPGGRLPVFVTYFGYTNLGSSTVLISRGVFNHNFFYPGNSLGNSWPNTFLPGYHPFAVALVWNLSPGSQDSTANWKLLGNFASLAMPTDGTVTSPLAVTAPFCSLAVTSSAQILSTTGTALAQRIAGVRGDFGNPTTVVTPIGVTGGAGGISVSNLVYTRSHYEPSLRFFIPGYITADIAVSAWATPAQFAFQIAADGEPTQHISIPISYDSAGGNCAANVTSQTIVTLGGFSQNIVTRVWSQTVRVQNSGASPIPGPVLLALDNLSANAALTGGNGVTNCATPAGSPYVSLGTGLAPGQTAAVTLTFTNAQAGQAITYTPRILSGGTQQ